MDRSTAVLAWREVCGSDLIMAMPPTGRLLEAYAKNIETAERKRCILALLNDTSSTLAADPEWYDDVKRCLEDVSVQMRATGHGDERFTQLLSRMATSSVAQA